MSGVSQASAVVAARHALSAAIAAALEGDDDVDQYFGFQWPITKNAWVALTSTSVESDPKTVGPRKSLDETLTFHASIGAWVAGKDDAATRRSFDRAFGILTAIQTYIREQDITLGDTVLWCLPGSFDSDGTEDEDGSGYVTEIDASFVCTHRVRGN